jgi:hypothetical protein
MRREPKYFGLRLGSFALNNELVDAGMPGPDLQVWPWFAKPRYAFLRLACQGPVPESSDVVL